MVKRFFLLARSENESINCHSKSIQSLRIDFLNRFFYLSNFLFRSNWPIVMKIIAKISFSKDGKLVHQKLEGASGEKKDLLYQGFHFAWWTKKMRKHEPIRLQYKLSDGLILCLCIFFFFFFFLRLLVYCWQGPAPTSLTHVTISVRRSVVFFYNCAINVQNQYAFRALIRF